MTCHITVNLPAKVVKIILNRNYLDYFNDRMTLQNVIYGLSVPRPSS
ncbi:hypothetical protein HMPREF9136_1735 [Prevotella dentalis DSM 3688]|uniref:Uncharacterized protein n=1 Tax=Prevotella dentalis (strain ATCC 49559 / DSM 3688 / JCM 13448 / NCTC 12043 / ES 2772) TaxID=908937 RepID=F9D4F7_PREDD|nr:hypothetical protein HMPREF9136_1735 [Prevotella dentalis DSM 3688]